MEPNDAASNLDIQTAQYGSNVALALAIDWDSQAVSDIQRDIFHRDDAC